MLTPTLFLFCGFVLLGIGAELMVSGSSKLAIRYGISPLIIGLTIVAFGTSAPELAVSVKSATTGHGDLALGNIIGSNIANIGLILGLTALVHPIRIKRQLVRRQIPLLIASTLLMGLLLLDGQLGYFDGIILSSGLFAYLGFNYVQAKAETESSVLTTHKIFARGASLNILAIVSGIALLVFGSQVFVDNAIILATLAGVSEAVVGLTVVAIGTSIPELATSLVAAWRKQSDIAIGNILGSNLFNILCILGVSSLIISINGDQFVLQNFVIMLLFSLLLLPMAWSGLSVSRMEGVFLLSGYGVYLVFVTQQG
ncbi:MAG: calcium/sodium antiporter [Pseudohongiella sp.]|jgi:cation:H+ antiporter|nr:calcium/sodium antiporter [Pseudohongiella sp.]